MYILDIGSRMTVIRVGKGQTKSGKILDGSTRWFELKDTEEAIRYAQDMNKELYVSINKQGYRKINIEMLLRLAT